MSGHSKWHSIRHKKAIVDATGRNVSKMIGKSPCSPSGGETGRQSAAGAPPFRQPKQPIMPTTT